MINMKLTELVKMFVNDGIDDIELKKENNTITIGYFINYPTWLARITNGALTDSLLSRWEKTEWLFKLIDEKTKIDDDYFLNDEGIKTNQEVLLRLN